MRPGRTREIHRENQGMRIDDAASGADARDPVRRRTPSTIVDRKRTGPCSCAGYEGVMLIEGSIGVPPTPGVSGANSPLPRANNGSEVRHSPVAHRAGQLPPR